MADLGGELLEQYHPTRNGDVRPDEVLAGSSKRRWWICKPAAGLLHSFIALALRSAIRCCCRSRLCMWPPSRVAGACCNLHVLCDSSRAADSLSCTGQRGSPQPARHRCAACFVQICSLWCFILTGNVCRVPSLLRQRAVQVQQSRSSPP